MVATNRHGISPGLGRPLGAQEAPQVACVKKRYNLCHPGVHYTRSAGTTRRGPNGGVHACLAQQAGRGDHRQHDVPHDAVWLRTLAATSGIAFDPLQGKTFGPIMAPVAIAAAVALVIFVGISNMRPGFGLMLNWAECVAESE